MSTMSTISTMKLDLHKLINQFWQLRRSKRITSKQADLYYFLIQECNGKFWENPFECSNKLIIASIDMQEPTLIDARNRLKQLGLIDFKGGIRNEASPTYRIIYLNSLSRNRGESIDESIANAEVNDEHYKEKTKTKTKKKTIDGAHAPPPQKSFKEWNEKEFGEEILKYSDAFSFEIRNAFFKYWKERSASGKMKFQLERTWETNLRLEKWKANDEKFNQKKSNGSEGNQRTNAKTGGAERLAAEVRADLNLNSG